MRQTGTNTLLLVSCLGEAEASVLCCLSVALTLGQSVVKTLGHRCWFIGKEGGGRVPGTMQEVEVTFLSTRLGHGVQGVGKKWSSAQGP